MTAEQRERLGAAKTEEWGVFPEDIAAIRAALADVDALADALEALLDWQSLAPDDEIERARVALRLAGRLSP